MLPARLHPKERKVYELSNGEDFLPGHNAKTCTILHFSYTFYFLAASRHLQWQVLAFYFFDIGILEFSKVCYKQERNKK
jgi:hypothetical protein